MISTMLRLEFQTKLIVELTGKPNAVDRFRDSPKVLMPCKTLLIVMIRAIKPNWLDRGLRNSITPNLSILLKKHSRLVKYLQSK